MVCNMLWIAIEWFDTVNFCHNLGLNLCQSSMKNVHNQLADNTLDWYDLSYDMVCHGMVWYDKIFVTLGPSQPLAGWA